MAISKMMIYSKLIFFIFTAIPNMNEFSILGEMFEFLGLSGSPSEILKAAVLSVGPQYECEQISATKKKNLRSFFDSGSELCGWEASIIRADCKGEQLHNIQLVIRNALSPQIVKETLLMFQNFPTKEIKIPVRKYPKEVIFGYKTSLGIRFLTHISVLLNDNSNLDISCGELKTKSSFKLDPFQRFNGFIASYTTDFIGQVSLNSHIIKPKSNIRTSAPQDYYQIFETHNIERNKEEDAFVYKGPFGKLEGDKFEDTKFYGHWKLNKIIFEVSPSQISSIQIELKNELFAHNLFSPIRGNIERDEKNLKTVMIPENSRLTFVYIYLDSDKSIIGLKFFFSNGSSSALIGKDKLAKKKSIKRTVFFSSTELITGLNGFTKNKRLVALGFIVSVQNGEDITDF